MAAQTVTLYGRLNVALESAGASGPAPAGLIRRESNNRSVFGMRGEEDLGGGMRALFQIEGTLSPDTGAATSWANRDTRVGLSTPWGLLFAGHWVLPYLQATSGLDPYYPTTGGYTSLMGNGSAASANHTNDRASFDRRQQNSLHFWTPAWHGMVVRAAYAFNEGERGPGGSSPSLWSLSLTREEGPWSVSLAREEHRGYQGPGLNDSGTKVGVAWQAGDWRFAAVGEQLRYETSLGPLRRRAVYASATWQVGAGSWRLGLTRAGRGRGSAAIVVGSIAGGDQTGASQWTFGYDHAFSKRTGVYAYASQIRNESRAAYNFAINPVTAGVGARPHVTALGVRHSF